MTKGKTNECTYSVEGMHCAACEVLIEKKILKQKGVTSVNASTKDGTVHITYDKTAPKKSTLNNIFKEDDYSFGTDGKSGNKEFPLIQFSGGELIFNQEKLQSYLLILGVVLLVIFGFFLIDGSKISSLLSVNSGSSLPAFFVFGLLAGTSSCAALVGGVVLSMSKQWGALYSKDDSFGERMQPHVLFNVGRLLSFAVLGGVLGLIGGALQISISFSAALTIGISVMMIFLGLQMLGVKQFQRFQFSTPKFFSRYISNEENFSGKYMPAVMGALTFFLPCGFTITAQGLALASGNLLQGALLMLFFSIGTLPMLVAIGLSSVKFLENVRFSNTFLKIAGILVLFFAVYNINSQLVVLNLPSLNDISSSNVSAAELDLPPIVDGKQILDMDAYAGEYSPSSFVVRQGVPVVWNIHDKGTSGCTNAVISRGLFDGEIRLTPGETSTKEFTPTETGKYRFSCWMGMVTGTIEVVDSTGSSGDVVQAGDFDNGGGCDGSCGGTCDGGCGCGK